MLSYLYPNYVIGAGASKPDDKQKFSSYLGGDEFGKNADEQEAGASDPASSDTLKQEEILRKFYSGDINLLICTFEVRIYDMIHSHLSFY